MEREVDRGARRRPTVARPHRCRRPVDRSRCPTTGRRVVPRVGVPRDVSGSFLRLQPTGGCGRAVVHPSTSSVGTRRGSNRVSLQPERRASHCVDSARTRQRMPSHEAALVTCSTAGSCDPRGRGCVLCVPRASGVVADRGSRPLSRRRGTPSGSARRARSDAPMPGVSAPDAPRVERNHPGKRSFRPECLGPWPVLRRWLIPQVSALNRAMGDGPEGSKSNVADESAQYGIGPCPRSRASRRPPAAHASDAIVSAASRNQAALAPWRRFRRKRPSRRTRTQP